MVKGDKGKFAKRGGKGSGSSRFLATSAEEIEQRNNRIAEFDAIRSKRRSDEDGEDDDDDDVDDVDEEKVQGKKEEPSSTTKVETQLKHLAVQDDAAAGYEEGVDGTEGAPIRTMTRKERELADKERAAAEYRRKHELGLTEEYKRDMAKLEEIRKRREAAAQRALEDKETKDSAEKEARERALKMGLLEEEDEDDEEEDDKPEVKKKTSSSKKSTPSIQKLDKITIKKMKPAQLKDALKARDLDIQGNSKELTDRLLEFEAAR
jgi:hypothetical protein